jgi:hypothetical protein
MAKKETKTRVKKEVVKEVKVVEEVVVDIPKRYYVDFYIKREPIAKDVKVGTIFYSDTTESIEIEGIVPNYGADIKGLLGGVIMFMDGPQQIGISPRKQPKEWVLNLHKAGRLHVVDINTFLYASEARINNETE